MHARPRAYSHAAAAAAAAGPGSENPGKSSRRGEGGGILQAGAAVPARLTPPRLCGAQSAGAAGGTEAPGAADLRQDGRSLPRHSRITPRPLLHNKSRDLIRLKLS